MKILLIFLGVFCGIIVSAQIITLTEVVKVIENKDKFFYKLDSAQISKSIYLGKIEVQGFSSNDIDVFNQIYKKAKTTGANSYVLSSYKTIDNKNIFRKEAYFLNLYYIAPENYSQELNTVYIISEKESNFKINGKKINLEERSFYKTELLKNEITDISTKKLLGSRIKLQGYENQKTQYFEILGAKIKSNDYGSFGVNIKTGDIIKLEKSYAEFLISIYTAHKQPSFKQMFD